MKLLCIEKIRNRNNQIIAYRLQDKQGSIKVIASNTLKDAIRHNRLEVINLKLASDNKLIDRVWYSEDERIKQLINKSKILGYSVREINTVYNNNNKCILISNRSADNHILYIPDNITILNGDRVAVFAKDIEDLKGHIKVIGGHNLIDASSMFYRCQAQSIDLTEFDTSKVRTMESMFNSCTAKVLDLSNLDTSNVTDMHMMFSDCGVTKLDVSNFDTCNVEDMLMMFSKCNIEDLDLSSFRTSRVSDMRHMFSLSKFGSLDISRFNTIGVLKMSSMFSFCETKSLDLSSFNTINVIDMNHMFEYCTSEHIDISNFVSYGSIKNMFKGCNAQLKVSDSRILKEYKERILE